MGFGLVNVYLYVYLHSELFKIVRIFNSLYLTEAYILTLGLNKLVHVTKGQFLWNYNTCLNENHDMLLLRGLFEKIRGVMQSSLSEQPADVCANKYKIYLFFRTKIFPFSTVFAHCFLDPQCCPIQGADSQNSFLHLFLKVDLSF